MCPCCHKAIEVHDACEGKPTRCPECREGIVAPTLSPVNGGYSSALEYLDKSVGGGGHDCTCQGLPPGTWECPVHTPEAFTWSKPNFDASAYVAANIDRLSRDRLPC